MEQREFERAAIITRLTRDRRSSFVVGIGTVATQNV